MTENTDIDALIEQARERAASYEGITRANWSAMADALEAEHKRAEAYLADPDFDKEHARVVAELRKERERADEAVSQRNRAYRQRDEERDAKEGNIRALNEALAAFSRAEEIIEMFFDAEGNIVGEQARMDDTWNDTIETRPMTDEEREDWGLD